VANNNAAYFKGSTTTNQSYGPYIDAGTSSSDYAFWVRDVVGSSLFKIRGDGAATFSGTVTSAGFTTAGIASIGQVETTTVKMSAATTLGIKNNSGTVLATWDHSSGVFTQSYPATFSSYITAGGHGIVDSGAISAYLTGYNGVAAQVSNNAYWTFTGLNSSGTRTFYVTGAGNGSFSGTLAVTGNATAADFVLA
jgi:hypothetical protein